MIFTNYLPKWVSITAKNHFSLTYSQLWNEGPISVCLSLTSLSSVDSLFIQNLKIMLAVCMEDWSGSWLW